LNYSFIFILILFI
jgi:hypothetical protein